MDSLRREIIVETVKAWFQFYPAEAKAFARQLKYDWEHQNKGGRWGTTKAGGYKKYSLPNSLVWTGAAISQELLERGYEEFADKLLFQDDDDVRVIAQEFPDFMCRMNMDKERPRRHPGKLIV